MGIEKKERSHYYIWVTVFAVFLIHLFLAKKWFGEHFVYDFMDSHVFLDAISQAYQKVVSAQYSCFDFSIFKKLPNTSVGNYWPPLPALVGLWTLLALPFQWFFLQNFFYLAAIMLGIFFSAKRLCGDDFYSALAAVIFSCYWMVEIHLVSYEVQLATTTCIVWGFYEYLRSEYFTKFWPVVFMSAFTVLALYCDRLSPAIFLFSLFLISQNFKRKKSLIFMALALILVVAGAWSFYWPWVHGVMNGSVFAARLDVVGERPVLPPAEIYKVILRNPLFLFFHLSFYFIALTEVLLGYGFTGLLALGIILFPRLNKPGTKTVWVAMTVPLIFFMLFVKKNAVYIFPLCIYFAIISAIGVSLVRHKAVRYTLIGLIIGLTAIQYDLFFMPPYVKTPFFSHRYLFMKSQGIPRLYWFHGSGQRRGYLRDVFSILGQIRELFPGSLVSGAQSSTLIVDLQDQDLQHAVGFFLRLIFPKLEVINFPPPGLASCGDPGRDSLYLLSDQEKYEGSNPPKSILGCPSRSIKPESRLSGGPIVLYQVER